MKKLLCILLMSMLGYQASAQLNLTLRSNLPYPVALANIWGYVDTLGNEYALVGTASGISIVNVTNPDSPVEMFTVPGATSEWREIRTKGKYAFVTTENGTSGLQIVDLSNLPASINSHYWSPTINGTQLKTIHALQVDGNYLYLYGSNIPGGSGHGHSLFIDVTNPWTPSYVGQYIYPGGGNSSYVHDGYVRNDTMYEGHIYNGFFAVVDVHDHANPHLLATQNTPGSFTHNTWLSDDSKTLFTTDEVANSFLTSYDLTDLANITEKDRIQSNPGSQVIVHNTHVINDYCVTSWYKDGVLIVDGHRPENLVIVANYDTYAAGVGNGFNGDWGAYPYLPSGNLLVSDIDNGLFVFTPNYVRASYLEGIVIDSLCGTPITGATVEILTTTASDITNAVGSYKTGVPGSGVYSVKISKPGYTTQIIPNVSMVAGQVTNLNIHLLSPSTINLAGSAREWNTPNPIADVQVVFTNATNTYQFTSDANGLFTSCSILSGTYDVYAGKWGYHTLCLSGQSLTGGTFPLNLNMVKEYYDDFTFDFGWTVSGPSANAWVRGVPVQTLNGSAVSNPGSDASLDCSNKCYVTDNGGGAASDHDVDFGSTILTSPEFDATGMIDPVVRYDRWFYDAMLNADQPNDSMKVYITDGTNTVTVENVLNNSTGNGTWVSRSFHIADYLAPTTTMKLIVDVGDPLPSTLVEGGIDRFVISNSGYTTISEPKSLLSLRVVPNPFHGQASVVYTMDAARGEVELLDVFGRRLMLTEVNAPSGTVNIESSVPSGICFVRFKTLDREQVLKVVKMD